METSQNKYDKELITGPTGIAIRYLRDVRWADLVLRSGPAPAVMSIGLAFVLLLLSVSSRVGLVVVGFFFI